MKTLILAVAFIFAHAQEISEDPARHIIGKEGQIFAIRITPMDKKLEIRFVDSPLAVLEPSRVEVSFRGDEAGNVAVVERAGSLHLMRPLIQGKKYDVQIRDKVTNKSETLKLEVKPKP